MVFLGEKTHWFAKRTMPGWCAGPRCKAHFASLGLSDLNVPRYALAWPVSFFYRAKEYPSPPQSPPKRRRLPPPPTASPPHHHHRTLRLSAGMGRPDGEDNADLSSDDSPWSDTVWSEDDDDDEVRHSSHFSPSILVYLSRLFFFISSDRKSVV